MKTMRYNLLFGLLVLAMASQPVRAEEKPAPAVAAEAKPATPAATAPAAVATPTVAEPAAGAATAPVPVPPSIAVPETQPAVAGISIASKLVRQGYFQMQECQPSGGAAFNECMCKADIFKPELLGASPAIADAINKQLAQVPQQLAGESCQGAPIAKPVPDVNMNESGASFSVAYQTPTLLTVLVTYSTYGAGSAHPLSGTEGYTFDLKTGQAIDPAANATPAQLDKLNQFIQTELNKKYAEMLFDEIKTRTDPYVSLGACDSCTLFFNKDGWNIRFQIYAVAPYSAGEPTLTIPNDILPSPEPATSH
ncbi:MAG: RsiV family protein [Rickettsiales bacterium]